MGGDAESGNPTNHESERRDMRIHELRPELTMSECQPMPNRHYPNKNGDTHMNYKEYVVTLRHDRGVIRIATTATDHATARRIVLAAECAPESAVLCVAEAAQ